MIDTDGFPIPDHELREYEKSHRAYMDWLLSTTDEFWKFKDRGIDI